jgi:hypothetical protein
MAKPPIEPAPSCDLKFLGAINFVSPQKKTKISSGRETDRRRLHEGMSSCEGAMMAESEKHSQAKREPEGPPETRSRVEPRKIDAGEYDEEAIAREYVSKEMVLDDVEPRDQVKEFFGEE